MSAGCVLGGLLCLMDFFYYIDLICRRNFATAVATKGLSARPLESFGHKYLVLFLKCRYR